jgi:hypothetical protein
MNRDREKYMNPYGKWSVQTEGDCEGKTTRYLGTFEGYLDDIAFALADKCYYSLEFTKVEDKKLKRCPVEHVDVNLSIESGTWDMDMTMADRVKFFKDMLQGRDVKVTDGNFYSSVCLHQNDKEIERAVKENDMRKKALSKLTDEEKKLLGIYK